MTNASPLLYPTQVKQSSIGINPLSLAAPANNCDSFVFGMMSIDLLTIKIYHLPFSNCSNTFGFWFVFFFQKNMAMTSVAMGKIEIQKRKE